MKKDKEGVLTVKQLKTYKKKIVDDPRVKLAMNAVTRGNLQEVALSREVLNDTNFCFTYEVETPSITDQKKSGTCWMFAELNWLRIATQKKFKMKDIEFSQNYVMFWDKLEKSNYFLEQIINLIDRDLDDRKVHFLLHNLVSDGGEWHMLVNLIQKYGIVPKSVMPDTFNRENSRYLNEILKYKLREQAAYLRKLHAKGKTSDVLRRKKKEFMEEIYRILVIFMGVPPEKFDWSYRDKDKNYHQDLDITPQAFYEKYIGVDLDSIYTLISCPSSKTPYYQTYTIEFFNNMIGGKEWIWLNVPINELKKVAVKMLRNGEPCLYGCDVVQESHTKEGLMFHGLYDYDLIFNTRFKMDKGTRLDYGQSVLTHSMVLTGVEMRGRKPVRWKVENSWGTDVGKKGFFIMSDQWFDEYTYDVIVPEKYLSPKLKDLFKLEPIQLPPWFPMA